MIAFIIFALLYLCAAFAMYRWWRREIPGTDRADAVVIGLCWPLIMLMVPGAALGVALEQRRERQTEDIAARVIKKLEDDKSNETSPGTLDRG